MKATELDEADFQIIVALAVGKTQAEAGSFVITPTFPQGMTDRSVRTRIDQKRAAYDRNRVRIAELLNAEKQQFEDLTKTKYLEKLASLRAKGYAVKEKALDAGLSGQGDLALAVKVADGVEERDFGRPTQTTRIEGEVNHNLLVWKPQPVRALLEQERHILDSDELLKQLPEGVLDAEVIEGAN